MMVLDHTDERWLKRYKRVNGAETYSKDLMRYQLQNWKEVADEMILATCPKFTSVTFGGSYRTAIQYLHTFPAHAPLAQIVKIAEKMRLKQAQVIFISAYKAYADLIRSKGYQAVYIPMSIDVGAVKRHASITRHNDRILWFGNVDRRKRETYNRVKEAVIEKGYGFDRISHSRFNGGRTVDQAEAWGIMAEYSYAVAVGRCALEAFALGCRVLVAGAKFGGVATNDEELLRQQETNFNARYSTFGDDIADGLDVLPTSVVFDALPDIRTMNHAAMVAAEYTL